MIKNTLIDQLEQRLAGHAGADHGVVHDFQHNILVRRVLGPDAMGQIQNVGHAFVELGIGKIGPHISYPADLDSILRR